MNPAYKVMDPPDDPNSVAARFERYMTAPPPTAPVIPIAAAKGPVSSVAELAARLIEIRRTAVPITSRIELPDRDTAYALYEHLYALREYELAEQVAAALLRADALVAQGASR